MDQISVQSWFLNAELWHFFWSKLVIPTYSKKSAKAQHSGFNSALKSGPFYPPPLRKGGFWPVLILIRAKKWSKFWESEILRIWDSENLRFPDSQNLKIPDSQNPRSDSELLRSWESQNSQIRTPDAQNLRLSESQNLRFSRNLQNSENRQRPLALSVIWWFRPVLPSARE